MPELILASASPRRQDLLKELGLAFSVMPQDIDESPLRNEEPEIMVQRLASEKARAALATLSDTDHRLVLGSDTIVVCDDTILGKPLNKADACAMLKLLSGRQHQVMTAVAVMSRQQEEVALAVTQVTFKALSEGEIDAYWESGEPADKAGAYALQGLGSMFVRSIQGSYSAVVGLPIFETVALLAGFGIDAEKILRNRHHG